MRHRQLLAQWGCFMNDIWRRGTPAPVDPAAAAAAAVEERWRDVQGFESAEAESVWDVKECQDLQLKDGHHLTSSAPGKVKTACPESSSDEDVLYRPVSAVSLIQLQSLHWETRGSWSQSQLSLDGFRGSWQAHMLRTFHTLASVVFTSQMLYHSWTNILNRSSAVTGHLWGQTRRDLNLQSSDRKSHLVATKPQAS